MTWYEEEVAQLEQQIKQIPADQAYTVFYGSSSIRLWSELKRQFKDWNPLNLGFGGSTLAACVWYFERLIAPLKPHCLVVYAGDNDIGDGRLPEEVLIFYQMLVYKTRQHFGDIPIVYMSIKPSLARLHIGHLIKRTNKLIRHEIRNGSGREYFLDLVPAMLNGQKQPRKDLLQPDGLHLSETGYAVWEEHLQHFLQQHIPIIEPPAGATP